MSIKVEQPTTTSPKTSFVELLRESSARSMNLTNVTRLDGQATYKIWSATMTAVFKSMRLVEVVIDGLKPDTHASEEEKAAYELMNNNALGIIIQVVSPEILNSIIEMENPHIMWNHLRNEYRRDTPYALVFQLGSLCQLAWAYKTSMLMSEFVQKFETEWVHLLRLARDSSDTYRQEFAQILSNDKAKRDFLLAILSCHLKNVIDDLTTKDDLTFSDVKQRLLELDNEKSSALVTTEPNKKAKNSKPNLNKVSKNLPECSYCRKHHPSHYKGHEWTSCRRLKEFKKKRPNNNGKPAEASRMTSEDNKIPNASHTSQFVPDF